MFFLGSQNSYFFGGLFCLFQKFCRIFLYLPPTLPPPCKNNFIPLPGLFFTTPLPGAKIWTPLPQNLTSPTYGGWVNETEAKVGDDGIKSVTVRCRDKEGEGEADNYVIAEAVKEEEEEGGEAGEV